MIAQISLFFIMLFSVSSVFANKNEANRVNGFCKEVTAAFKGGAVQPGKIKSIAAANFGEELVSDTKTVEKYKNLITQIFNQPGSPQAKYKKCREMFVKEFTTYLGRKLLGRGKEEQQPGMTDLAHAEKVEAASGGEELHDYVNFITVEEQPVKSLCLMNEIADCEAAVAEPINDLVKVVTYQAANPEPYSTSDCDCYEQKTKLNKANTISKSQNKWDEIDHLIIKATGEKFINDYANFYEDMRFYDLKAWALTKQGNENSKNISVDPNVLCVDPEIFKKSIAASCAANGTTKDQEARTTELLSSMGNHFKGSENEFSNSFKDLIKDIDTIPVSLKNSKDFSPGEPLTVNVSRRDFEESRARDSREMPDVAIVDELISIVTHNKELKAKLDAAINDPIKPLSPFEAMKQMFSSGGIDTTTLKKTLEKVTDFAKNKVVLKPLLDNLGKDSFDAKSAEMFRTAAAYHPGLKNILLNKDLFNKVSASVGPKDIGVLLKAEGNSTFMSFFQGRCQNLKEQLAQAVCTKTADLKNKADKNELIPLLRKNNLLHPTDADSKNVVNLALCSMRGGATSGSSAFTGLPAKGPFASSDYKLRKDPQGKNQKDMFSNYAQKIVFDKDFLEKQKKLAEEDGYLNLSTGQIDNQIIRHSQSSDDFLLDFGDLELRGSKINPGSAAANLNMVTNIEKAPSTNTKPVSFVPIADQFTAASSVPNIPASAPMILPPSAAKTPEPKETSTKGAENSPVKEELKNSFPKSDEKKVDSLISNLNDEDAKEFLRWKKQIKKEKDDVSNMELEQQKKKTLELQSNYEALEKKLDNLTKSKSSADSQSTSVSSNDFGKDYKGQGVSKISEKTNLADFQATSGSASGTPIPTNSAPSLGGSLKGSSGGSNAVSNQAPESKSKITLMITSQQPTGVNRPEDPSQELIAFLAKNEPDFKTLNELKDSGIIFTYVVNENGIPVPKSKVIKYSELSEDAKKLVDQKILKLENKEAIKLKEQIKISRSAYSYQALKLELLSNHKSLNK
jgi:hypothetical protein